ncbi:ABC transporter permease [Cohnella zeiphila]|uniref:ABC-2 family transporter protein n=1 Tax=Cohnella zeiphila TaxID=2761120 RepID=A0A7X0SGJ5_9BACL|nr:ABC-2 family transporter protein [Cohnella zeiphila]MBB6729590.1 ABC-2 family transporter protein [Cohnella zeiphila]
MSTGDSGGLRAIAAFLGTCWKINLASALEYRLSFALLAGMMFINNFIWLFFWNLFFSRFPIVQGWELRDVMLMWAIGAGGFGWVNLLFGNFTRIATIVSTGELDLYLAQPKPVLLHVLASRMSITAAGDFVFGLVIFAWVGERTLLGALAFALGLLLAGLLFLGVMLHVGCLAFFIGNSEGIAQQALGSFVSLSTYPSSIFKGAARAMLFSLIPAGFISYLPIGLLKHFDPWFVTAAIAATALIGGSGIALFRFGLKRYASGNLIAARS